MEATEGAFELTKRSQLSSIAPKVGSTCSLTLHRVTILYSTYSGGEFRKRR